MLDASPSPSDPTITQTIGGLMPGNTYFVSGDFQYSIDRGGGSPTDPSFRVSIDGLSVFEAVKPDNLGPWYNFSILYTPTTPSVSLSVAAQVNGTGVTYHVDNISMQVVPEPSALVLFSFGGLLLWPWIRKGR